MFFLLSMQSQASRPEQSVMQALESLTETQVRGCFFVSMLEMGMINRWALINR